MENMKKKLFALVAGMAVGAWAADAGKLAAGFDAPPHDCFPETWYHFINGNVTKEGIAADLDALKQAGVSGVQFFHGGGIGTEPWPGVPEPLNCLSAKWDDCVRYIADECHTRGLTFKMQNCPGWSMSGGPWIKAQDAMRSIAWSTTFSKGGKTALPLPATATDDKAGRDWRDIVVVAFPRPAGDGAMLEMKKLPEQDEGRTLTWEATSAEPFCLRTLEMPCAQAMNHGRCYDPEVSATLAVEENGKWRDLRTWAMPRSNWQDDQPLSLATPETTAKKFRVTVAGKSYAPKVPQVRLFGRAYPHSWESESANCLRELMHDAPCANAQGAYVDPAAIKRFPGGASVELPPGDWTVLRIGHVNTLRRNGPAPAEATGWECDKLAKKGIEQSFKGYVGRLTRKGGPLEGKLDGMILDSWECCCQTWTDGMDTLFKDKWGYGLENWWPALCGYVVGDREKTTCFYRDWRVNISDLLTKNFYGRMGELARQNGFSVAFETASGDVFPGDILEYYKGADVPMCEYWRAAEAGFGPKWIENPEFKPFRPTVSAARLYGKKRVDAEALTGGLSWNEDFRHFKWHVDRAFAKGVTHHVFHTCTHNPQPNGLPPGPSFGDWQIGSPFVRGQRWWKLMPYFTKYLARCTWMLEQGQSAADVLVYLGDEQDHKPRENSTPVPAGYEYDYLNPDGLMNFVSVKDGRWVTKAGLSYAVLYVQDNRRLRPGTLQKLEAAKKAGAEVVGLAGDARTLADVLAARGVKPDVETLSGRAFWQHRRDADADWYFLAPADGQETKVRLRDAAGRACEIWNPRTGSRTALADGVVAFDESVFVVAHKRAGEGAVATTRGRTAGKSIVGMWTVSFDKGFGRDQPMRLTTLKPWKDLAGTDEAKHYAGTATYAIDFEWDGKATVLETPHLEGVAEVRVNGQLAGAIWCAPMRLDLAGLLRPGKNHLEIMVVTPWYNRLVYDAGQPVEKRKTWTRGGPGTNATLKVSGLLPPVLLK